MRLKLKKSGTITIDGFPVRFIEGTIVDCPDGEKNKYYFHFYMKMVTGHEFMVPATCINRQAEVIEELKQYV